MTTPNLYASTSITAKTSAAVATTSYTAVVSNAADSNKVYKINTILVSNTTTNPATVSLDLYRNSISYPIASTITVPNGATIVILSKDSAIYLEEGDAIRILGSAATSLTGIISYEVIS